MFYLLLALSCSVVLSVLFKLFPKYEIDTFQAIVYNYVICVVTGSLFLGEMPISTAILAAPWMPQALGLGVLFIVGFYWAAMTVRHFGIAVASVVQRMSLVISVPFAIVILSESDTWNKIVGVLLALAAVVLTNISDQKQLISEEGHPEPPNEASYRLLFYPIAIFLSSGVIECTLQYVQARILPPTGPDSAYFTIYTFGIAALAGLLWLAVQLLQGKFQWANKNLIAGILLGIPNYFSIFFLIKSFDYMDKSIALPINNIGILAMTALLGVFLFGERLRPINWLGVLLAMVAIGLIAS